MDETNYFDTQGSSAETVDRIFSKATSFVRGTKDVIHELRSDQRDERIPPYTGGEPYYYEGRPSTRGYSTNVPYAWGTPYDPRMGNTGTSNAYPGISNSRYGMSIINTGGRY